MMINKKYIKKKIAEELVELFSISKKKENLVQKRIVEKNKE